MSSFLLPFAALSFFSAVHGEAWDPWQKNDDVTVYKTATKTTYYCPCDGSSWVSDPWGEWQTSSAKPTTKYNVEDSYSTVIVSNNGTSYVSTVTKLQTTPSSIVNIPYPTDGTSYTYSTGSAFTHPTDPITLTIGGTTTVISSQPTEPITLTIGGSTTVISSHPTTPMTVTIGSSTTIISSQPTTPITLTISGTTTVISSKPADPTTITIGGTTSVVSSQPSGPITLTLGASTTVISGTSTSTVTASASTNIVTYTNGTASTTVSSGSAPTSTALGKKYAVEVSLNTLGTKKRSTSASYLAFGAGIQGFASPQSCDASPVYLSADGALMVAGTLTVAGAEDIGQVQAFVAPNQVQSLASGWTIGDNGLQHDDFKFFCRDNAGFLNLVFGDAPAECDRVDLRLTESCVQCNLDDSCSQVGSTTFNVTSTTAQATSEVTAEATSEAAPGLSGSTASDTATVAAGATTIVSGTTQIVSTSGANTGTATTSPETITFSIPGTTAATSEGTISSVSTANPTVVQTSPSGETESTLLVEASATSSVSSSSVTDIAVSTSADNVITSEASAATSPSTSSICTDLDDCTEAFSGTSPTNTDVTISKEATTTVIVTSATPTTECFGASCLATSFPTDFVTKSDDISIAFTDSAIFTDFTGSFTVSSTPTDSPTVTSGAEDFSITTNQNSYTTHGPGFSVTDTSYDETVSSPTTDLYTSEASAEVAPSTEETSVPDTISATVVSISSSSATDTAIVETSISSTEISDGTSTIATTSLSDDFSPTSTTDLSSTVTNTGSVSLNTDIDEVNTSTVADDSTNTVDPESTSTSISVSDDSSTTITTDTDSSVTTTTVSPSITTMSTDPSCTYPTPYETSISTRVGNKDAYFYYTFTPTDCEPITFAPSTGIESEVVTSTSLASSESSGVSTDPEFSATVTPTIVSNEPATNTQSGPGFTSDPEVVTSSDVTTASSSGASTYIEDPVTTTYVPASYSAGPTSEPESTNVGSEPSADLTTSEAAIETDKPTVVVTSDSAASTTTNNPDIVDISTDTPSVIPSSDSASPTSTDGNTSAETTSQADPTVTITDSGISAEVTATSDPEEFVSTSIPSPASSAATTDIGASTTSPDSQATTTPASSETTIGTQTTDSSVSITSAGSSITTGTATTSDASTTSSATTQACVATPLTADFSCTQDSVVSLDTGDFYTALCRVSLSMNDDSYYDDFDTDNAQSCVSACDDDISCQLAVFKKGALGKPGHCTTYQRSATIDDYVRCDNKLCLSNAVDVYNFNPGGNCDDLSGIALTVINDSDTDDDLPVDVSEDNHCAVPTYIDGAACVEGEVTYYAGNYYQMQCNRAPSVDSDSTTYSASSTQGCLDDQSQSTVAFGYSAGVCTSFTSVPVYLTGISAIGASRLDLLVKLDTSTVNGQTCPVVTY